MHPYPEAILVHHLVKWDNVAAVEVLIKWQGAPDSDATWERYKTIADRFSDANLEDKVLLPRGVD